SRVWEEARRYGFISAGGGSWYSQTLKQLQPDDRVWVKIPATGYVGVGIVQSAVEPASSFTIKTEHGEMPAIDVLKYSDLYRQN
ncbi:nuclease, partial [Xanthomonas citri pv. citri]|nr:nuclease [Xanthomonas citri pv. citri]